MTYSGAAARTVSSSTPRSDVDFPVEAGIEELPMTPAAAD